jgi:hypothetical protein
MPKSKLGIPVGLRFGKKVGLNCMSFLIYFAIYSFNK